MKQVLLHSLRTFVRRSKAAETGFVRRRLSAGQPFRRPRVAPPLKSPQTIAVRIGPRLVTPRSWACQLQNIDSQEIERCQADVLVIDCEGMRASPHKLAAAEIEAMKTREWTRERSKLLAYVNIAAAEPWRSYWQPEWVSGAQCNPLAPKWLDAPAPTGWNETWMVRFWDLEWKRIVYGDARSIVDSIIEQGFDGVYLDGVDGYDYWLDPAREYQRRPTAASEMAALVCEIAEHARIAKRRPDFAIVPHNCEALLVHPAFCAAVSAIAVEDVLFAQEEKRGKIAVRPRPAHGPDSIEEISSLLRVAFANRIPVLAAENLLDGVEKPDAIAAVVQQLRGLGLAPHIATRNRVSLGLAIEPPAMLAVAAQPMVLASGISDPAAVRIKQPPKRVPMIPGDAVVATDYGESIIPGGSWDKEKMKQGGYVSVRGDSREPIEAYEKRMFVRTNGQRSAFSVPARPWSAICYLELAYPSGPAIGTGCLIGPRTVLTAAHNLYDRDTGREVTSIRVIPGRFRHGVEPFGSEVTSSFAYDLDYRSADRDDAATQCDFGVVFLSSTRIHEQVGLTMPAVSIETSLWTDPRLGWINIAGFPDENEQLMWARGRPQRLAGNVVIHDVDTTPGQSGSPIYWTDGRSYKVLAIHTEGIGFDQNYNAGVRITPAMERQLTKWCERPGSAHGAARL